MLSPLGGARSLGPLGVGRRREPASALQAHRRRPYVSRIKPPRWNLSTALVALEWQSIRSGLVVDMPMWGDFRDYSGRGNHGTLNGPNPYGSFERGVAPIWSGDTDPTAQYAKVEHSDSLPTGGLTIETLVRMDGDPATNQLGVIARKRSGGDDGFQLLQNSTQQFRIDIDAGGLTTVTSNTTIPLGSIVHLAVTWDGATITIYVDGLEDGSGSRAGTISATSYLMIGGDDRNTSVFDVFTGPMAYLRMWDVGLSAANIRRLARNPFGPYTMGRKG